MVELLGGIVWLYLLVRYLRLGYLIDIPPENEE